MKSIYEVRYSELLEEHKLLQEKNKQAVDLIELYAQMLKRLKNAPSFLKPYFASNDKANAWLALEDVCNLTGKFWQVEFKNKKGQTNE